MVLNIYIYIIYSMNIFQTSAVCIQGIQTARLPIGAYMKLASSQVLTVNHVVEILLSWLELSDWQQAFYKVIPTRKRTNEQAADTSAGQGNGAIAIEGQQELEVPAQAPEAADTQNAASGATQTVTTGDAASVPQSADLQCQVTDVDSEPVSKRLRT